MHDFSLTGYRRLLSTLQEAGYAFSSYAESELRLAAGKPFVILRHDIDISLRPALQTARVEHEQGITATYFVLLRSPFYNLLCRPAAQMMQQIHEYGHQLALHIDLSAYDNDCEQALQEIKILQHFYPFINPQIASLHSPLNLQQLSLEQYPALHTVYDLSLRQGKITYISDSTGRWLYGHPLDSAAFLSRKPVQLLIHPIWWIQDGESARAKLDQWFYHDYEHTCTTARAFLPKLYRMHEI